MSICGRVIINIDGHGHSKEEEGDALIVLISSFIPRKISTLVLEDLM